MQERVRVREPGLFQRRYVERVAALEALLDAAHVEDFAIETDRRRVTDVAREMLARAGWPDDAGPPACEAPPAPGDSRDSARIVELGHARHPVC
jgi:hypothetical protein